MDVQTQMVEIPSGAGTMPAFLARPKTDGRTDAGCRRCSSSWKPSA
jgi:hypothetical protein